jgi:hypothetical protein
MSERLEEELALLRTEYPDLEHVFDGTGHWIRIASHPVRSEIWGRDEVEVACQIPAQIGVAPYAFRVRPGLALPGGALPTNYTYPAATPWGSDWGQFSWSPMTWLPTADIRAGANMLKFIRSFAERLGEAT